MESRDRGGRRERGMGESQKGKREGRGKERGRVGEEGEGVLTFSK